MMSRYQLPDIADGKWVYRGKRYCAFELGEKQNFEGMTRDLGEVVFYDKFYGGVLAMIKKLNVGYRVELLVQHGLSETCGSLEQCFKRIPSLADYYFKISSK